jgi:hypothetical protein
MKIALLIFLAAALAIGIPAGWHAWKSSQSWKEGAAESERKRAARDAVWHDQLAALARLRPGFAEVDASYPAVAAASKPCAEKVRGETPFFDRRHLKELIQPTDPPLHTEEYPPYKTDEDFDFKKMESLPYWVVYTL